MSDDYTGNGTNCGLGMVYETREEKEIERQRKQITTLRQQVTESEIEMGKWKNRTLYLMNYENGQSQEDAVKQLDEDIADAIDAWGDDQ